RAQPLPFACPDFLQEKVQDHVSFPGRNIGESLLGNLQHQRLDLVVRRLVVDAENPVTERRKDLLLVPVQRQIADTDNTASELDSFLSLRSLVIDVPPPTGSVRVSQSRHKQ